MDPSAPDRHFQAYKMLREQMMKRYMDMPRQPAQNPNFSLQPLVMPQGTGDQPIYPDGPLSPDQQWNRLEQNLLGPVPPINGTMPGPQPSMPLQQMPQRYLFGAPRG